MRTTSPLGKLFGRSPFRPIQEHMEVVHECVETVLPLFEALRDRDRAALLRHKQQICELENRSDELKNDIRSHLPKSLFMPVDRRDLLDLLNAQDSIADACQDIAELLARIDHRFGNEGDFGRPERFSESFAIDPVQVE